MLPAPLTYRLSLVAVAANRATVPFQPPRHRPARVATLGLVGDLQKGLANLLHFHQLQY